MTDTDQTASPGSAVVLASGGMDSATTAYEARAQGYDLHFLHTSYGQHTESKEYECARAQANELDAAFHHVETDHLASIGGSSLTDESGAVPDAADVDDADEPVPDAADTTPDEIPSTYVPFRNANLLSMAVAYAEANDCDAVFVGAHSEDHGGYPDCRPQFFEAFQRVVDTGTADDTEIGIEAPFVDASKTDIAARGRELEVPYDLTWSCYRDDEPACGTCDSCARRLEAFQDIGERDPIAYRER
ncbi:succinoglycan biosynthesis ExsB protein [Halovivax asiaticus JCM 14624]|uniref:7-cyano-7-deazaguanine synthase n=1 Tax=Halovivax asiaticus JCM 14624 TaxID=1227490 RepID=M0BP03_9EURY|nr:7-cyano-7-deazaguanine synthase QueC [Halovivax asiaticus]ELZ12018.1 succinoglycan biosynthesis ExsB protein [Halovivax asiaticus JCM 14624]